MVQFISNKNQLADALIKSLPPIRFKQVQRNLNVHDLPSRLRGGVESQVDVTEIHGDHTQKTREILAVNQEPNNKEDKIFSCNKFLKLYPLK